MSSRPVSPAPGHVEFDARQRGRVRHVECRCKIFLVDLRFDMPVLLGGDVVVVVAAIMSSDLVDAVFHEPVVEFLSVGIY